MTTQPRPPNAESAISYFRRGWSVIPMHSMRRNGCSCRRVDCPSPGKHPRVKWEEAMTTAPGADQVGQWWERWPDANVGVATGAVSGVAVIDVDPRHEGDATLDELEAISGPLPLTLESRTGGGGRHIWFTIEQEDIPSVELGAGLELKAERGLIVAPPSRHYSGETYRWLEPVQEPAPLPEWVSRIAVGPGGGQHAQAVRLARTALEQEEFRDLWLRAGVDVAPGDSYYLCPFHDDHHPSLHIDAVGCRWYCFACRMGGGSRRLLRHLGIPSPSTARSRMRGHVGHRQMVTLEGEEAVAVVGESFHQDELLRLTGGRRRFGGVEVETVADLVPIEGEGVEVWIDDFQVGFLGEGELRFDDRIADSIEQTGFASCRATIRGGWDRGGDDVGLFGVTLLLPPT
ncbi:MAG TPA: bifunctional DNA primase/polymerase [Acidimicrobiia bacterium]|nr:bifunctional DNA primase/polymerase [Acidimicrobiia bacterium]